MIIRIIEVLGMLEFLGLLGCLLDWFLKRIIRVTGLLGLMEPVGLVVDTVEPQCTQSKLPYCSDRVLRLWSIKVWPQGAHHIITKR